MYHLLSFVTLSLGMLRVDMAPVDSSFYSKLYELKDKCALNTSVLLEKSQPYLNKCSELEVLLKITELDDNTRSDSLCLLYLNNYENLCAAAKSAGVSTNMAQTLELLLPNITKSDQFCGSVIVRPEYSKTVLPLFTSNKNVCLNACKDYFGNFKPVCYLSYVMVPIAQMLENYTQTSRNKMKEAGLQTKPKVDVSVGQPDQPIVSATKNSTNHMDANLAPLKTPFMAQMKEQTISETNAQNLAPKTHDVSEKSENVQLPQVVKPALDGVIHSSKKVEEEENYGKEINHEVLENNEGVGNVEEIVNHKETGNNKGTENREGIGSHVETGNSKMTGNRDDIKNPDMYHEETIRTEDRQEINNPDDVKQTQEIEPVIETQKVEPVKQAQEVEPVKQTQKVEPVQEVKSSTKKAELPNNQFEEDISITNEINPSSAIKNGPSLVGKVSTESGKAQEAEPFPEYEGDDFGGDMGDEQPVHKSEGKVAKPYKTDDSGITYPVEMDGDSYFFSYFMMLCIVFVLGYVGYHNKQKILAIIVEGRRGKRQSRGRRPNSANYHKLDCNLEEAVTSACSKSASQVIY